MAREEDKGVVLTGILDRFRGVIRQSVWKDRAEVAPPPEIDDKIALGVLLWVVAQADQRFLPEEQSQIEAILRQQARIAREDLPVVMQAVAAAARERIDLYTFTQEVRAGLSYEMRVAMIENLFRVACADHELAAEEEGVIREMSGLLRLDHRDFIAAKIKVKREAGMDTAGL